MSENYFSLFQIPMTLPIDLSALTTAYQQLQKQYHPDNFATAKEQDKLAIVQQSAMINTAYQTLKDPIKAAEHLLSIHGIDINQEHHTIKDSHFLMQQFELREQLDEIEEQEDWQRLEQFYHTVKEQKQATFDQLMQYVQAKQWQQAKEAIYQLRYFFRLIDQITLLQDKQFVL